MPHPRDALTPDALAMLQTIAQRGSFAAAARELGMVPSALTYRVRQIEDALDVLLFDRSSRQARPTEAGQELLREGLRVLDEIDALANRVKRMATGWEPQLTIAVDSIISRTTVLELCEAFLALDPPTRLRLRDETLSGTLAALTSGQSDIALGVILEPGQRRGIQSQTIGTVDFVYAVAPHHPLAAAAEPLSDDLIRQHRAVAVADSIQRGSGMTIGILGGQDVFTVPSMPAKLDAQLRGLGGGFLPVCLAEPFLDAGHLVAKRVVSTPDRSLPTSYAWRTSVGGEPGRAMQWWLKQLGSPATRRALLDQRGTMPAGV